MVDQERAEVATDALRKYRDYLQGEATDTLESIKSNVEEAKLPVHVWGVRLAGFIGNMPRPEGSGDPHPLLEGKIPPDADPTKPETWPNQRYSPREDWVDDPLTSFKKSYEAAHEGAVSRLDELLGVLDEVAMAMNRVADYYDETEEENTRDVRGIHPE